MLREASRAGVSREDANDAAYAVVALADQIAMARSEAVRQFWASNQLQLHYFQENVAGEAFFTRLAGLRREPRKRELLEVYYLALLLGFQGRYRVRGGDLELMTLVEELQREVYRGNRFDDVQAPRAERPEEVAGGEAAAGPRCGWRRPWSGCAERSISACMSRRPEARAASPRSRSAERRHDRCHHRHARRRGLVWSRPPAEAAPVVGGGGGERPRPVGLGLGALARAVPGPRQLRKDRGRDQDAGRCPEAGLTREALLRRDTRITGSGGTMGLVYVAAVIALGLAIGCCWPKWR